MIHRYTKKLLIVAMLITIGLMLELAGLLEPERLLHIARGYSDYWWLAVILILLQIVFFTFALAGSVFLWVVAPIYPPEMATFILAAGGTLGGVGAYLFSNNLTHEWIERIETSHVYRLLHDQGHFLTLFALRVFPAFPHSLVNYSSGILNIKLSHFIPAAILGISIKSYIYSKIIYNATTSASLDELLDISTFGPLILLSVILLLGVFIKYKLSGKNE